MKISFWQERISLNAPAVGYFLYRISTSFCGEPRVCYMAGIGDTPAGVVNVVLTLKTETTITVRCYVTLSS